MESSERMGAVTPRQLRRRCKAIIRGIDIPSPFDIHRLCDSFAARRGRPIDLHGIAMPPESPSGAWVSTASRDYIFYEVHTAPLHQEHIIAHEFGHIISSVYGRAVPDGPDVGKDQNPALASYQATQLAVPDLDPTVVERLLHRTAYSEEEEHTAELIATMVLERANRWRPVSEWDAPSHTAELRRRIHLTIESPKGDHR